MKSCRRKSIVLQVCSVDPSLRTLPKRTHFPVKIFVSSPSTFSQTLARIPWFPRFDVLLSCLPVCRCLQTYITSTYIPWFPLFDFLISCRSSCLHVLEYIHHIYTYVPWFRYDLFSFLSIFFSFSFSLSCLSSYLYILRTINITSAYTELHTYNKTVSYYFTLFCVQMQI